MKSIINLINFLTKHVVIRYLIAGGTAGVTDLVVLYLMNSVLGMHYLFSQAVAFIVAFVVSFTGHKFWTFKSHNESTHRQVVLYFLSSTFGLFLNTLLMYIFVDLFHIGVIVAQIMVGFSVAAISFSISRKFVFKYNPVIVGKD